MIPTGKGAKRPAEDYHLSRYACYLIVQNADSEKPIVALGQAYFAVQTRRQELADQLVASPEDQKRLILRSEMAVFNQQLAEAARNAGVIRPQDFAVFQDHGYMGFMEECAGTTFMSFEPDKNGESLCHQPEKFGNA